MCRGLCVIEVSMWQPPKDQFFEVRPIAPQWGTLPQAWVQPSDSYRTDPALKRAFGEALARLKANDLQSIFKAACEVFASNTNAALWVTHNWVNDPLVIEARKESPVCAPVILDKEQFAAKVLELAEAKSVLGVPSFDDKERVNLLKLYAEVRGFIGKSDTTINNNTLVQGLTVKLVKPEKGEPKTIDATPIEHEISNANVSSSKLRLKLVS